MNNLLIKGGVFLTGIILIFTGFGMERMPGLVMMLAGLGMLMVALYLYNRGK